jgi:hypothetical protein
MEKLTKEQLLAMSKEEVVARFNLLVDALAKVRAEVDNIDGLSMSAFMQGLGKPAENYQFNVKLRIIDTLTRPFAASNYADADSGVKAIRIPTY